MRGGKFCAVVHLCGGVGYLREVSFVSSWKVCRSKLCAGLRCKSKLDKGGGGDKGDAWRGFK